MTEQDRNKITVLISENFAVFDNMSKRSFFQVDNTIHGYDSVLFN